MVVVAARLRDMGTRVADHPGQQPEQACRASGVRVRAHQPGVAEPAGRAGAMLPDAADATDAEFAAVEAQRRRPEGLSARRSAESRPDHRSRTRFSDCGDGCDHRGRSERTAVRRGMRVADMLRLINSLRQAAPPAATARRLADVTVQGGLRASGSMGRRRRRRECPGGPRLAARPRVRHPDRPVGGRQIRVHRHRCVPTVRHRAGQRHGGTGRTANGDQPDGAGLRGGAGRRLVRAELRDRERRLSSPRPATARSARRSGRSPCPPHGSPARSPRSSAAVPGRTAWPW